MQRAVLDRATIEVADTTEVSDRVTADEVNLDQIHNRIRKVCALVAATLILPALAYAQNNQGDDQGNAGFAIPNGTYSFRDDGQVTVTPPGSSTPITLLIAAAGRITFIPTGTMNGLVIGKTSGVLTASINGQISPITIKGTFQVNKDGSVFETEQQTGGPNALLHFTDYPTPDGNTITFVATDSGSIVSGIDTR